MSKERRLIETVLHNPTDHSLSVVKHDAPSGPNFIHVKVHATSLCAGELLWPEPNAMTHPIPGYDFSGTVISAPDSSAFKPGDEVYAMTAADRQGAAREEQVALEAEVALRPKSLTWEEAASVPLSALSAWQDLFVHAGLPEPELALDEQTATKEQQQQQQQQARPRVLVTAASGGVGSWVVQFASLAGAYVVATCGSSNVDLVKGLGATEVLDYSKTSIAAWVEEDREGRCFDVVIDCKGGEVLKEAWTAVKADGFLNSITLTPWDEPIDRPVQSVRTKFFIVDSNRSEQLVKIAKLIDAGRARPTVDSIYEMGDCTKAFERVNSGHARGKVVLRVAA